MVINSYQKIAQQSEKTARLQYFWLYLKQPFRSRFILETNKKNFWLLQYWGCICLSKRLEIKNLADYANF